MLNKLKFVLRHQPQLQQNAPKINIKQQAIPSPKLTHCQSKKVMDVPKPLQQIVNRNLSLPIINLSEMASNEENFESARLQGALKEINQSLGINEIPELVGQIRGRKTNLEFVINRVHDLLILASAHQQAMDLLANKQMQIIANWDRI
ncbi:Hypothetical_protein [Hexamita inflata]|uniref:Hypothetical_protein n=1 Tax=Hexamita inflata TaxID=28002 RepID=A0AA86TNJ5_9EUKA|nr:Hypothetical protein HINF_LOCUS5673 [Hexamita inflata]